MKEIKGWEQQERPALASVEAKAARDAGELSQRTQILKDLALALLSEVQTLGDAQTPEADDSIDFYEEVRRFEIALIRRALKRTGGHQMRAARLLNVKVTTLNSKIKRYRISPEAQIYNYPTIESGADLLRRRA